MQSYRRSCGTRWPSVALSLALCGVMLPSAEAKMPPGKLVMLDIQPVSSATSIQEADNTHLRFEELIEAGVNGVHFRHWTPKGDGYPSKEAWVEEAHEWGLWVAGGTGVSAQTSVAEAVNMAKDLAEMNVDFIQLDEPMGHDFFDGAGYKSIQDAVKAVSPDIPVVVTDVFYNDKVAALPNVDGLIQEVYFDDWFQNIGLAENYRSAHPDQDVLMWVWLPERQFYPGDCGFLPDSKFDLWFNESFDRIDKTLLFIFYSRETMGDDCSWGANWDSRAATIAQKTEGYRAPLPMWGELMASAPPGGDPDAHVQVRSDVGLNPDSTKVEFSLDFGASWTPWGDVQWSGSLGTTEWVDITVNDIPIEEPGDNVLLRFKITDTYEGTYYRGPRTARKTYVLNTVAEVPDDTTGGTESDGSGSSGSSGSDGTGGGETSSGGSGSGASAGTDGTGDSGGNSGSGDDSAGATTSASGGADTPSESGCGCTSSDDPRGGLLALGMTFFVLGGCLRRKKR